MPTSTKEKESDELLHTVRSLVMVRGLVASARGWLGNSPVNSLRCSQAQNHQSYDFSCFSENVVSKWPKKHKGGLVLTVRRVQGFQLVGTRVHRCIAEWLCRETFRAERPRLVQPTYLHKHDAPLCFPFSLRAPLLHCISSRKWEKEGQHDGHSRRRRRRRRSRLRKKVESWE